MLGLGFRVLGCKAWGRGAMLSESTAAGCELEGLALPGSNLSP